MSSNLDHALAYAEQGWLVFPCHTPQPNGQCDCRRPCSSPGKHPRTLNGLNGATTDLEEIRRWWGMWPTANIAIATGAKSGLIVLDVDPKHGGAESIKRLAKIHGLFPERVFQKTGGGGWHILFKHPGIRIGNIQSSNKLGEGIDVRGDGGYIVVAPSLHPSGKQYEWGSGYDVLPEAPRWLIDVLKKPEPSATHYSSAADIPSGQRNNTLTSIAGALRRKGLSEGAICAALKVENVGRCVPPLEDVDVERIAKSIARYTPETPIQARDPEYGEGIYTVNDLSDAVDELYEQGLTPGASTGWKTLDQFYTPKRGQWTALSGVPSHGKTSWLDAMLVNLAINEGWKFCVCSPENQPIQRHIASLMSLWAGEPFSEGHLGRMSPRTKDAAKDWVQAHFTFVLPLEKDFTVEGVLDLASEVQARRPIDGLVLDPWNELEHKRPAQMSETEYVSQSLTFLRRYARAREIHLWLVIHPTKLHRDRISGTYPVPTLYDCAGCHAEGTEVLTTEGWKDHSAVTLSDSVCCFDPAKNLLRYEQPQKLWEYDYSGKMYHFKSPSLDALVTPNHRILVKPDWHNKPSFAARYSGSGLGRPPIYEKDKWTFKEARELRSDLRLPWSTPLEESPEFSISDAHLRIIGWWVSEGWNAGGSLAFCQANGELSEYMQSTLKESGFEWKTQVSKSKRPKERSMWRCRLLIRYNKAAHAFAKTVLAECGNAGCATKKLPRFTWLLSQRQKRVLLNALIEGDGTVNKRDGQATGSFRYSTTSQRLADDVQRLSIELGQMASVSTAAGAQPNHKRRFQVNIGRSKRKTVTFNRRRNLQIKHYEGKVYCLTVSTGAYLVRRNGKVGIYGNSAHFRNKADMGVIVWRDLEDETKPTEIHVQKVRFKECGRVGMAELFFDKATGRYSEEPRVHRPSPGFIARDWTDTEYEA